MIQKTSTFHAETISISLGGRGIASVVGRTVRDKRKEEHPWNENSKWNHGKIKTLPKGVGTEKSHYLRDTRKRSGTYLTLP